MIASKSNAQSAPQGNSALEEHPDRLSILSELERIQASRYFRGSTRGKQFLTYVVQHALEGRTDMLKERVIGTALFNKPADYATGEEPVVRVQAGEVRRRLHDYYLSRPSEARVLIELVTGSYTPTFRWLTETVHEPPSLQAPLIVPGPSEPARLTEAPSTAERSTKSSDRKLHRLLPWAVAAVSLAIAIVCVLLSFYPALFHKRTELDRFWAPAVQSKNPLLICVGQLAVYLPRQEVFDRYAASHHGEFSSKVQQLTEILPFPPDQEMKWKDFSPVEDLGVAVGDVYAVVQLSRLLEAKSKMPQLRVGQNYTFQDLRSSPSILVGAFNNKWSMQLTSDLRYRFDESDPRAGAIVEGVAGGRSWRETTDRKGHVVNDFGLVTRLVNSKTGQFTVTVAGIGAAGTEAATEAVSNAAYLHETLRNAPADWDRKNLEFVVQATVTDTVASPPRVVATYFW